MANNVMKAEAIVKVYKRRYVMLILTCLVCGMNVFQSFEYTSISNTVTEFYGVSDATVTTTFTISSVVYIVLLVYAIHFLNKYGIAVTLVVNAVFAAIGSYIKCFSVHEDRFYVLVIGQALTAVGQTFGASLSPVLAARWFQNNEVATVIGAVAATQTVAAGIPFLVVILFGESTDRETMHYNMKSLAIITAAVSTIILIAGALFMEDAPPHPPSNAQKMRQESNLHTSSVKNLLKSGSYISVLIAYVCSESVNMLTTVLLNQILMSVFPNDVTLTTLSGIIFCVSGIIGSLAVPILLDKFKKFKLISLLCLLSSTLLLMAFSGALMVKSKVLVYITMFTFGSMIMGYSSIGPDIAVDVTYPQPEATSVGIMYWMSSIPPIVLAPLASSMVDSVGVHYSVSLLIGLLLISTVVVFCSDWKLKRHSAENKFKQQEIAAIS